MIGKSGERYLSLKWQLESVANLIAYCTRAWNFKVRDKWFAKDNGELNASPNLRSHRIQVRKQV